MSKIDCGDCPLVDVDVYDSCYRYCERMKSRKESDYQQGRADAIDELVNELETDMPSRLDAKERYGYTVALTIVIEKLKEQK